MSNKVYKKVNKYNIGSWLEKNAGGVASALGGAASLVSDVQGALAGNQDAINNTKAGINQVNNTTFNAGNTSSLMSQWSSANYMDPVTSKQLRSDKGALEMLSGASKGASAGASFGPWGAIIGGAAGIGTGLASWLGGKSKARKRARKLNDQIANANERLDRNFETAVDNLEEQQLNNALMNYAAYGGPLETNGITWPSELMFINNGGTHEQNPNEGIQIGVDSQGVPNLVEEGEIIYGDYVFSNRLKVPKKIKEELKLGKKDITFADAVEKFSKESEERPNDPISKLGLEANLNKLIASQEEVRYRKDISKSNQFPYGGPYNLFLGQNIDESRLNDDDYFSRLSTEAQEAFKGIIQANKDIDNSINNITFDDNIEKIGALKFNTSPLEVNMISKSGNKFKSINMPDTKITSRVKTPTTVTSPYGTSNISKTTMDEATDAYIEDKTASNNNNKDKKFNWQSLLRYAPVIGNAIGLLTNKADYSNIDAMANAINNANVNVSPEYLNDYLPYNPFDINYQANKIKAQAAANRRAIINNSSGNRGMANAALLAADFNNQIALGDAYRGAAEYNQGLKERVANFNRVTNQYNSQTGLQADIFNADNKRALLGTKMQELALRESERNRYDEAKSANITSLFDNLGAIGKEQTMIDTFNKNPYLLYKVLTGEYKACGGKIKRRRK